MRRFLQELKDFPKKCDWVLLLLCLITAAFGLVIVTSATSAAKFEGNTRYIVVQLASIILGVIAYAVVSSIDIESMSERRNLLVGLNLFLLLLSIFYLCYSKANYKLGTMRMPKEGFMPLLLGIGMVGLSSYLTVQAFLNKGDAQNVKFGISWKRFFVLVSTCVLYAVLLGTLGYLIATFLFLFAVFKIANLEGMKLPLILSLVFSVAFYILFKVLLGVMLPSGLLGL